MDASPPSPTSYLYEKYGDHAIDKLDEGSDRPFGLKSVRSSLPVHCSVTLHGGRAGKLDSDVGLRRTISLHPTKYSP